MKCYFRCSAVAASMFLTLPAIAGVSDVATGSPSDRSATVSTPTRITVKIHLTENGKVVTGRLVKNATSTDFRSLLPLTLTLEDYAGTEKIAYLPRKLSTQAVPPGFDPSVGDIAYYAPWGNLAIFHKDAPYTDGLVHLGHIDAGLDALAVRGTLRVTVELTDQR